MHLRTIKTVSNLIAVFLVLIAGSILTVSSFAADVTPSSITVYWTSPGDNGNEGVASMYDIRYSTSSINAGNWGSILQAEGEPTPHMAGTTETYTIGDLIPDTWYYIAIMTADEVPNWSDLSNVIAVKTQSLSLDVDEDKDYLPDDFHLAQNYPNPFNPSTRIEYSIPITAHVTISIYNILGQHTATIVDEIKPAGNYSVAWDLIEHFLENGAMAPFFYASNSYPPNLVAYNRNLLYNFIAEYMNLYASEKR